jgi:hypothetical protein
MAAEGDLVLELGMTMTRLNRQLAAAEQRFSRAAAKIERGFNANNTRAIETTIAQTSRLEAAFTRVGRVAGTVLGVVIGQGLLQVASRSRATIAAMSSLAKEADRVGASIEDWQALQFGFGLAGVSATDFTKSMEMFSQRIGEAAEGSGELFKTLRDNGIAIRNASGQIRPINDLLREYADLIARTSSESSQLALVNDAFGRGGRDMVNALRGGAVALDEMGSAARRAGAVLGEDFYRRAEVVDDQLATLTAQLGLYMKQVAVFGGEAVLGLKMLIEDIVSLGTEMGELERRLASTPNALRVLGIELEEVAGLTDAQVEAANDLIVTSEGLLNASAQLSRELGIAAGRLEMIGQTNAANTLREVAEWADAASVSFEAGNMTAQEFNSRLETMTDIAQSAFARLASIDDITLSRVQSWVESLAGALGVAARAARLLELAMPGGSAQANTPAAMGPAGGPAPSAPPPPPPIPIPPGRPQARPLDIDFGYSPATGGGRGGSPGGGSSAAQDPEWWDDLIEKVREGEQAWEDYNRTVEDGALAMADFFGSIVDGSKSAKEALADLLMQLAQVQFQKAFLGLAGGGGAAGSIFSALGSALTVPSFDGGGYTGSGARSGGVDGKGGFPALLHPNETVIDHSKGGSGGGGQVSVVVRMENGNLVPVIESVSGSVTARAMSAYDRQLAGRVRQISGDRRSI